MPMNRVDAAARGRSRAKAADHGWSTPIARRASASQNSDIAMNAARNQIPDHLVPQASPKVTIAAMRHGRAHGALYLELELNQKLIGNAADARKMGSALTRAFRRLRFRSG